MFHEGGGTATGYRCGITNFDNGAGAAFKKPVRLCPAASTLRAAIMLDLLLHETFDAPGLDGWTSYVGGENEKVPSWRVEAGTLAQPEEDGLIRAILTGDAAWGDYCVEARIRIDSTKPDSRAGLVFRDDGRGFYVLRFTRSSGRAQLMYHSRAPFGWHELATVPVRTAAASNGGDGWVDVRVEARGPFLRCYIDGNPYIDIADSRARAGRFGFYACEARARFDDLKVSKLQAVTMQGRSGPPWAPTVSFWFRETFTDASVPSWTLPPGWAIANALCTRVAGAGGLVASLSGAPFGDGLVQTKVRPLDIPLDDYVREFRALLAGQPAPATSVPSATPVAARAGLVFRSSQQSYYALLLDRANKRLTLVHRDDATGDEELLGGVEFNQDLEDRWYQLSVQCKGADLVAVIDGIPCLSVNDTRHSAGYVGLFADEGPVVFTDLLAASGR